MGSTNQSHRARIRARSPRALPLLAGLGLIGLLGGPAPADPAPPWVEPAQASGPTGDSLDLPAAARIVSSPWTVFLDSIRPGGSDAPWRPLSLGSFFSEGWDEAFVPLPAGTGGGLRQSYVNSIDGSLYRLFFFDYAQDFGLPRGGNTYVGEFTVSLPLNRRAAILAHIPFVTAVQGVPGRRSESGFGDVDLQGRAFLINSRNFDLVAALNVRIPTGLNEPLGPGLRYRPVGPGHEGTSGGRSLLGPQLQFWSNPWGAWVLRGGAGPEIGTNRAVDYTTFDTNLGLGYVLNPDDQSRFSGTTLTLALNTVSRLEGPTVTTVGLTPGIRTDLGGGVYFLAGLDTQLVAPRPYHEQLMVWLMKAW